MSHFKRPALLLFLIAAILRVAWVLIRFSQTGARLDWPDEDLHWQIASNLAQHGEFIADDGRQAARMPLYPLFLAIFAGFGGNGVIAAKLMQALLSAAIVPLGMALAARAHIERQAIVVGALLAFDPFAIFFCNLLLTETAFSTIAVALVFAAWSAVQDVRSSAARAAHDPTFSPARIWCIGLGVLSAAAILTRQSSILWVMLLLAWIARHSARRGGAAARLALSVVLIGAALAPWGLRNLLVLGDFAWLSANGGVTLYDALGPQADGSSNQAFLAELEPRLAGLSEVQRDRRLSALAWEQARNNPLRVLRLAGVKLARMWNPFPNVAEYRAGFAAWAGAAYTLLLLTLAAVALVRFRSNREAPPERERSDAARLLVLAWMPIVIFTLIHCIYIGSVRYRVPLMPLLALAGAGATARMRFASEALPAPGSGSSAT